MARGDSETSDDASVPLREQNPKPIRKNILGQAGGVGAATLASRVLGLAREHLFARLFGAKGDIFADAFSIAYRIPNLLRDLLAEGALSSAFVPTFTAEREANGDEAAFQLARIVLSALLFLLGGICLLGILFAPTLVHWIAPGFEGDARKFELTVELTRWMIPFILIASVAAVCRGIHNTFQSYSIPAIAPALFNVVSVATGLGLWWGGASKEIAIYGWAGATLVGGFATFAVQIPRLWRWGFRFRLILSLGVRGYRHPGFRRILRLMAPATIGLAAVQTNVIVNSAIATHLGQGTVTWLNQSFRLIYLPIGVIGVAMATVSTVNLSQWAARGDFSEFRNELIRALRLVAFLSLPAALGLTLLAEPITSLVYEYGAFTKVDTECTAIAMSCYAWSLFFYSGIKILAPAFYAMNQIRLPLVASFASVFVNITWSLSTYRTLGYPTLAVGSGLAATVNFAILAIALRGDLTRRLTGAPPRLIPHSAGGVARMLALLVPMGLATYGLWYLVVTVADPSLWVTRALAVAIPMLGALVVWFGAARGFGIREVEPFLEMLKRRRGSPPADPTDSAR